MNEKPSSAENTPPSPDAPASAAVTAAPRHRHESRSRIGWLGAALAVLAILLLAQWWNTHAEIRSLRHEVASRLKTSDAANAETGVLMKSTQEGLRELEDKVSVLESKQTEAQSHQVALDQLYQDLSKNHDDWALAEVEQVLSTASQQLQLAGNVQGALIALQNADNRLSHSDKQQFIVIRRAIARDMDRLKALPNVDITGITLRLDSIIGQIDNLPLLSDEKPSLPLTPPRVSHRGQGVADSAAKSDAGKTSRSGEWLAAIQEKWHAWVEDMGAEVRELIRVRKVDTPDALLLSPTQAYYARENLKLRLMNARLALLSRNEAAFRNDTVAAQDTILKYFDTRAKHTQVVLTLLKQVQNTNLSIEMPTLVDSLTALHAYKAKP